jgi:hypothetical protein
MNPDIGAKFLILVVTLVAFAIAFYTTNTYAHRPSGIIAGQVPGPQYQYVDGQVQMVAPAQQQRERPLWVVFLSMWLTAELCGMVIVLILIKF